MNEEANGNFRLLNTYRSFFLPVLKKKYECVHFLPVLFCCSIVTRLTSIFSKMAHERGMLKTISTERV